MKQIRACLIAGSLMLVTMANGMEYEPVRSEQPKPLQKPNLDLWCETQKTLSLTQSIDVCEIAETLAAAVATQLNAFFEQTNRVFFHLKNNTTDPITLSGKLWQDTLPHLNKNLSSLLRSIGARNLLAPFVPLSALITQEGYLMASGPWEETYHIEQSIVVSPGQHVTIIAFIKK